jgi:hypothetical protein
MNWWPVAIIGSVLVAVLFDIGVLIWFSRQPRRTDALAQRLERLTNALNLLTDTTEAGLTAVTAELQQMRRNATVMGSEVARASTFDPLRTSRPVLARRIVDAERRGIDIVEIARQESLSETEVRLHLALARRAAAAGDAHHASMSA